jgi:hypothetical protein
MTGGVYFPAYASLCDDQVARKVRRRFGHEGFDAYVTLLCLLLREDGGRLMLQSEEDWEDLGEQLYGGGAAFAKELVTLLVHHGAIVQGEGYIFSPLVSGAIATYADSREAKSRAARARWDKEHSRKERQQGTDADAMHDAAH